MARKLKLNYSLFSLCKEFIDILSNKTNVNDSNYFQSTKFKQWMIKNIRI